MGRPAAAAAFGAVALQVVSFGLQLPALKDAPGSDDPDRYRQTLINYQENAGAIFASSLLQALGSLLAAGVLLYLFRATRRRRRELPGLVRWLILLAPALLLVAAVMNNLDLRDISDRFTQSGAQTVLRAPPTAADRAAAEKRCQRERGRTPGRQCVSRQARAVKIAREDRRAKRLLENERSVVGSALGFGGTIALAFSYVMISLNAMRAGLLSRFLGVLGIIVGMLVVLPLLPSAVPVIQIFWLGAVGVLILGRWPAGRGPAWESGEAQPWPTAADLRAAQAERELEEESRQQAEADQPRSRKRKRKKKR
jgi:hypothetical protein